MKNIQHTFRYAASPEKIMAALMEERHLKNWWTQDAYAKAGRGFFEWRDHGWTVEMEMQRDVPMRLVLWTVTKSNMQNSKAWENGNIVFRLYPEEGETRMEFKQVYKEDSPCFVTCFEEWKHFLGSSLKSYVETGVGRPYAAETMRQGEILEF